MLYFIGKFISFLVFKTVLKFKVYGKEHIPRKGGFILASNHISYLDPLALGVACPRRLNYMARHDLFFKPWFAWVLTSVGAFPVKRDSADLAALKEAMQRVKNGKVLVVFPEGSRRFDSASCEPQPGIGFLASKLNAPVVPAFIRGTEIALPKGAKLIKPTEVSVHFGKQILIERGVPYQDFAKQLMEQIRHLAC